MIVPVELARWIGQESASLFDVRMALVCGSFARGLADESSDIDLYVYGEGVDGRTVGPSRVLEQAGAALVFGIRTAAGWFHKYRLDGRFVDVEFCDVSVAWMTRSELSRSACPRPTLFGWRRDCVTRSRCWVRTSWIATAVAWCTPTQLHSLRCGQEPGGCCRSARSSR
jgi:predicted nucleotidyltransferase